MVEQRHKVADDEAADCDGGGCCRSARCGAANKRFTGFDIDEDVDGSVRAAADRIDDAFDVTVYGVA